MGTGTGTPVSTTARTTMADLITYVRELIDDADEDDFTDIQVEQRLDLTRVRVRRVRMDKDVVEKKYKAPDTFLEGNDSTWTGSPVIAIWDGQTASASEVTPGESDSWNLIDGKVTFATDQDSTYYADYYHYDPYLAASHLCYALMGKKTLTAGMAQSGGVVRSRAELVMMARSFRQMAKPRKAEVLRLRRNRYNVGGRM